MNPLNYALKASKRLVDAGIMLKTDVYWFCRDNFQSESLSWVLVNFKTDTPAPTMAEVWRELQKYDVKLELYLVNNKTYVYLVNNKTYARLFLSVGVATSTLKEEINANPTEALIDILIWVRKENP